MKSTTLVENLVCGDVFSFRNGSYLVVANVVDKRTSIANVVAVNGKSMSVMKAAFVLQLARNFAVEVTGHINVPITVLVNTKEEIDSLAGVSTAPVTDESSVGVGKKCLTQSGTKCGPDDPLRAVWYSAMCTYWTDDWSKLGYAGPGIPTCPVCRSPGMITNRKDWDEGVTAHEAEGNVGYKAVMDKHFEKCAYSREGGLITAYDKEHSHATDTGDSVSKTTHEGASGSDQGAAGEGSSGSYPPEASEGKLGKEPGANP